MNLTLVRPSTMLVLTLLLGACGRTPTAPSAGLQERAAGQTQASEQEHPAATVQPPEPATTTAATALPAASGGDDSAGTTITLGTAKEYDVRFVPTTLEAPANTTVTLIFKNSSLIQHNVQFFDFKAKTKVIVPAGESDTITFTTTAAGSYTFRCSLYPDSNMIGTLQVK